MKYFEEIGFLITLRCPITCSHCIFKSGPTRKEEMEKDYLFKWIRDVAIFSHHETIVLSGGEPFLLLDRLKEVIPFASKLGLKIAVVTNAFWASTRSKATAILKELKGLSELRLSTDQFHLSFIPLEYIRNAILATYDTGPANVSLLISCLKQEESLAQIKNYLWGLISSDKVIVQSIMPVGRATDTISPDQFDPGDKTLICTDANRPTITFNGTVVGCCGPLINLDQKNPLLFGNLKEEELSSILKRVKKDYLLRFLLLFGPSGLIELIKEERKDYNLAGGGCYLCYHIFADEVNLPLIRDKLNHPKIKAEIDRKFPLRGSF